VREIDEEHIFNDISRQYEKSRGTYIRIYKKFRVTMGIMLEKCPSILLGTVLAGDNPESFSEAHK